MEIVCPAWYPGTEGLVDAIPLLADQGVTAVEICTEYPRFGISHPDYFDHRNAFEIDSLRAALSSSGIRVNSIHAPFGTKYDISSPCDEIHERGVDALIESIELASVVGARIVVVHGSDKITDFTSKRRDRARGVLREISAIAEASGVALALENLPPGYLGHTHEEMLSLIDGLNSKSVGICFDCGHANMSESFAACAETLLPYALSVHLHDNDGKRDQHSFPGEGNIDWHKFAEIYHNLNHNPSVTLECAPPTGLIWSAAFQRFRQAMGS